MMKLRGKRLLLMGGGAFAKDIQNYAEKQGIYLIAIGNIPNSPLKKIADETYDIDTQDVEKVSNLVVDRKVDGIFLGAAEENILPAIEICEKTGARFYAERKQWEILSNKHTFKEYAVKHGIPVPKEYSMPEALEVDDMVDYPVMVKPADGSGATGLNSCHCKEELIKAFQYAMEQSKKKDVVVESLITDGTEVFFIYTIQNGNYSLSAAFTKDRVRSSNHYVSLPIFHMYPSKYIDEYMEKIDGKIQEMFKDIGLKNGVITLQGFYVDGEFCFFEAGYRLGGEQMYILTDYINGVNSLNMMINYSLTGEMEEYDIRRKDKAIFPYPCCNYYVPLRAGKIQSFQGLGQISDMPEVLNITQMRKVGDVIEENNSLSRVAVRIHVLARTPEKLADALVKISSTLRILDCNGNEMQIEHLTYDRCIETIYRSIKCGMK